MNTWLLFLCIHSKILGHGVPKKKKKNEKGKLKGTFWWLFLSSGYVKSMDEEAREHRGVNGDGAWGI